MAVTSNSLREQLDKLRDMDRGYMRAPQNYKEFMPLELGVERPDDTLYNSLVNAVNRRDQLNTTITETKAQNEANYQNLLAQKSQLAGARKNFQQSKQAQPERYKGPANSVYGGYEGERDFGRRWGKDNTPEVSDVKNLDPWAGPRGKIVGVKWRGHNFAVNGKVADIFVAFLDDLYEAGYRPVSIGGYNDRNIAGTNTKSTHSFGYSIDIDPTLNPVQPNDGSMQHKLPPNVAALAAKYGLSWGGSWNSYKDPMHFSVAYGGVE